MQNEKEKARMSKDEIIELLRLNGWTRTTLAAKLHLSANAVQTWISEGRNPSGPASILMRMWLDEARVREAANGKLAGAAS